VVQSKAFIQLISAITLSFISKTEEGAKGKIAVRQRESEGVREREHWETADVVSVVKQTIRKYKCSNN